MLASSLVVRFALMLLGGVGAAYVLFAFLNKATQPYRIRHETAQQVREARAERDAQRAANEELQRRIDYLKSDEGAESEARRLGYYRKGETVYLLPQETVAPARTDAVDDAPPARP
mgnify:CR=1 FL=1